MTMRRDETDVNFLDLRPADLEAAAENLRNELAANRRAWDCAVRTLAYVREKYPEDTKLAESIDTIRHHLEKRL